MRRRLAYLSHLQRRKTFRMSLGCGRTHSDIIDRKPWSMDENLAHCSYEAGILVQESRELCEKIVY